MVGNMAERLCELVCGTTDDNVDVSLPDHDVGLVDLGKGGNLDIVPVGAALCHTTQICLKDAVDFCGRGSRGVAGGGVAAGIFPLRISTNAAARGDLYEGFVELGIFSHKVYDLCTNSGMLVLSTVELVGKGVEEAVACRRGD